MPYVRVTIAEGRSAEQKRHLLEALAKTVNTAIEAPMETIHVWLEEVSASHLSIAGIDLESRRSGSEPSTTR